MAEWKLDQPETAEVEVDEVTLAAIDRGLKAAEKGRSVSLEEVREALRLRKDREKDQAFKQLKTKLERGAGQAARGELLDGDAVFEELRQLIEERRRAHKKGGH